MYSSRFSFFDVEASGLRPGSFPVDVAWSKYGEVRSILVKPHASWNTELWDMRAQAIHGYPLPLLSKLGKDVHRVARILNDDLNGITVFSDNPDYDKVWTDMIFAAANMTRAFAIESVGKLIGSFGVSPDQAYFAFEQARETHPSSGKASAGVSHLIAVVDHLERAGFVR